MSRLRSQPEPQLGHLNAEGVVALRWWSSEELRDGAGTVDFSGRIIGRVLFRLSCDQRRRSGRLTLSGGHTAAGPSFNGVVFVQVIRGHVADPSAIHAALDRWDAELRPGATGFLGSTAGVTTDGELILVARFETEDVARQNSDRPEQAAWWSELEQALAGAAAFAESSAVDVSMGGGSDDAGFVQLFWGRGDRAAARSAMVEAEPILRRERPEILGGFTLWLGDAHFIDVAYFRSEQEAREGEARELSEEGRAVFAEFGRVLAAGGYADIREPRLR